MFQVNPLLIHMKNQASFSSKDKNKKIKCRLLQFLFGACDRGCCSSGAIMTKVKLHVYDYKWLILTPTYWTQKGQNCIQFGLSECSRVNSGVVVPNVGEKMWQALPYL